MLIGVLYLLLFVSPQVLLYLYLRERLPDPRRPRVARAVRIGLTVAFVVANLPWVFVAGRLLAGRLWGIGRIPYIAPFIAWQMLGWIYCLGVAVYVVAKALWKLLTTRERGAVQSGAKPPDGLRWTEPLPAPGSPGLTRRQFLARATYAYAAVGSALSGYGIWSADRLPELTRRTLVFPDLPRGLDGLRVLHLSDVHAGVHMGLEEMREIVRLANSVGPDLVVQTGDMIDISPRFIPDYVRAFRELVAPLGVVTVLGNHDRYTGEDAVVWGVREAGQVLVRNGAHVVERGGATLALLGVDDPRGWMRDDPQAEDLTAAERAAPPEAWKMLLAHRPGAFDGAAPRAIPLTLAGHIHGGQFYLPGFGWSPGRLITKYVKGHFRRGASQLYVSRGIGVVGIPIRVFAPPEVALLTLKRA